MGWQLLLNFDDTSYGFLYFLFGYTVIIAIDGPAGSGKSTTAKDVARRLGSLYIDTGAMYRAVAWSCLKANIDPESDDLDGHVGNLVIALSPSDDGVVVRLNGQDITNDIRSSTISEMSSIVSRNEAVRTKMVQLQRKMAKNAVLAGGSVVMEGRDIGTVVFPDAEFKFFLVADPAVRAKRRVIQLKEKGVTSDEGTLYREILERDARDETRELSPLRKAPGAIELDTSRLSFEEQVENIIRAVKGNG